MPLSTDEKAYIRWVMQTARTWTDISNLVTRTGIEVVDRDHLRLAHFALEINRIIRIFESGQFTLSDIQHLEKLLKRLYDYAALHFEREEALMQRYRVPELAAHTAEHAHLLHMLRGHIADFQSGKLTVALHLKLAIIEWLVHHINEVDYRHFQDTDWLDTLMHDTLNWSDLSIVVTRIGYAPIDHQHMAELAFAIEKRLASGQRDQLPALLGQMRDCASAHFHAEETYMALHQVPEQNVHQAQHQLFLANLAQFTRELEAGQLSPVAFKQQVLKWWINHINHVDYAAFCMEDRLMQIMNQTQTVDALSDYIFKTGEQDIDDEHFQLLHWSLKLNQQFSDAAQDSTAKVVDVLDALTRVSTMHFTHEEALIKADRLPNLKDQQEAHAHYLTIMRDTRQHLLSGKLELGSNIKRMILGWWVQHINGLDYETFVLSRNGIAEAARV